VLRKEIPSSQVETNERAREIGGACLTEVESVGRFKSIFTRSADPPSRIRRVRRFREKKKRESRRVAFRTDYRACDLADVGDDDCRACVLGGPNGVLALMLLRHSRFEESKIQASSAVRPFSDAFVAYTLRTRAKYISGR